MEQLADAVGNPTALLIERVFWLTLGGFFGLAIITSLTRGLNEKRNKVKPFSSKDFKDHTKKAMQKNK